MKSLCRLLGKASVWWKYLEIAFMSMKLGNFCQIGTVLAWEPKSGLHIEGTLVVGTFVSTWEEKKATRGVSQWKLVFHSWNFRKAAPWVRMAQGRASLANYSIVSRIRRADFCILLLVFEVTVQSAGKLPRFISVPTALIREGSGMLRECCEGLKEVVEFLSFSDNRPTWYWNWCEVRVWDLPVPCRAVGLLDLLQGVLRKLRSFVIDVVFLLQAHCGRYVHEHALMHHLAEPSHSMALSLADLTVWCYPCEAYVHNEKLIPAKSSAHLSKFGEAMPH